MIESRIWKIHRGTDWDSYPNKSLKIDNCFFKVIIHQVIIAANWTGVYVVDDTEEILVEFSYPEIAEVLTRYGIFRMQLSIMVLQLYHFDQWLTLHSQDGPWSSLQISDYSMFQFTWHICERVLGHVQSIDDWRRGICMFQMKKRPCHKVLNIFSKKKNYN